MVVIKTENRKAKKEKFAHSQYIDEKKIAHNRVTHLLAQFTNKNVNRREWAKCFQFSKCLNQWREKTAHRKCRTKILSFRFLEIVK